MQNALTKLGFQGTENANVSSCVASLRATNNIPFDKTVALLLLGMDTCQYGSQ